LVQRVNRLHRFLKALFRFPEKARCFDLGHEMTGLIQKLRNTRRPRT
jgi:hypothetical protein